MPDTTFTAFAVGKDGHSVQIALANPTLASTDVSDLGYLEEFEAQPKHSTITIKPISHGGASRFRDKWEHWEGSFSITRTGPNSDLLLQILQNALMSNTAGTPSATITQTVNDPSTSETLQFQFADATLTPSSGGKYTGDSPVTQVFTFMAPRRDLISNTYTAYVGAGAALIDTATKAKFPQP